MMLRTLLVLFCWLTLAAPAAAQVWKYVDAQGVTHFTNEAIPQGQQIIAGDTPPSHLVPLTPLPEKQLLRTIQHAESMPGYKQAQTPMMAAAKAHGLDYALVKAVAVTESAFNPNAISHKGAIGLMQIMPATAAQYGLSAEPGRPVSQKLQEPELNIQIGTRHLAGLTRLYPGRLDLALAAYNAGQGAVRRAGNQIPNYRETQDYVRKVMAVYMALQARG
jgi:soluble lytic murein transglycosylase-like protein